MSVTKRVGVLAAATAGLLITGSAVNAAVLLNDTWADGNRTNTALPNDSATWIGQSAGNGSNSVSAGSLNFMLPTNSLKVWEYFTADGTAPDTSQPHNSVQTLSPGDQLVAQVQFKLPQGAGTSTGRNFRMGLFWDPTDARVESDTNNDAGGSATSPWQDAAGYQVQLPLNQAGSNTPFQIGKRTNNSNTGLLSSGNSYTFPAANGGTAVPIAANTTYTVQLLLNVISASQLDVTASILDNTNATLSSYTVSDTGTAFGGTAINGTGVPNNNQIYTKFDQLFLRLSDNSLTTHDGVNNDLLFTNYRVEYIPGVPEPGTMSLLVMGSLLGLRRGRRN